MDVKQAFHEGADQGQIVGILAEREEWELKVMDNGASISRSHASPAT